MTEAELKTLIAAAESRFNALTLEQQEAHREEQRRSWARGEMALSALVKKHTAPDGSVVYDDYASYCFD
jgi:hypothetical protein